MTKGADNIMLEKINFNKSKSKTSKKEIENCLYKYSCEGLRTLVMA